MDSETEKYSILTEEDLRLLMVKEIDQLSDVISVPKSSATTLLARHGWSLSRVFDSWVEDEKKVLEDAGLCPKEPSMVDHQSLSSVEAVCGICFDSYPRQSEILVATSGCEHLFCRTCWGEYVRTTLQNQGGDCSRISCPSSGCCATAGPDVIEKLSDMDKTRYYSCLVRSFVEHKKEIRWCPAPECEYAVELLNPDTGDECIDVVCLCLHMFCWKCLLESHRPVTCNIALDWFKKMTDDSETLNWIVVNTKPCPSCLRPIEKDYTEDACSWMTCPPPCRFSFCWNCLRGPEDHRGTYFCAEAFVPGEGLFQASERRVLAASSLQGYTYCCDKWETHHQLAKRAASELHKIENLDIQLLSEKYDVGEDELGFTREAWMLIVQCWQLLKWSSVYEYFLSEYENAKKEYLRHLQDEAVSVLQRSWENVGNEMKKALSGSGHNYESLSRKLTDMTRTTGNYFHLFLKSLEDGLPEVQVASYENFGGSYWFCDRCTYGNYWTDRECRVCHDNLSVPEFV